MTNRERALATALHQADEMLAAIKAGETFTYGQWWDAMEKRRAALALQPDPAPVAAGKWETSSVANESGGVDWDVCEAGGGDMIADLQGCDNAEEHARLIASAPDMLAALRHVENHLGIGEPLRSEIKVAIARASGQG